MNEEYKKNIEVKDNKTICDDIYYKLKEICEITNSKKYKEAKMLIKEVDDMKKELKEYCKDNDLQCMSHEENNKTYSFYNEEITQKRIDTSLLEPELLENIKIEKKFYRSYFLIE